MRHVRFESSSPYRDKDGSIRRKLKVSFIYQAPGELGRRGIASRRAWTTVAIAVAPERIR
jgi:hypothetical protein